MRGARSSILGRASGQRALRPTALLVPAVLLIVSCGGKAEPRTAPTSATVSATVRATVTPTVSATATPPSATEALDVATSDAPATTALAPETAPRSPLLDIAEVRRALLGMLEAGDAAGGLIAVAFGDDDPVVVTAGVTDPRTATPVPRDGVLPVASITKSFVAATLLDLEHEGLVDLDAPIATYLEWANAESITVRQLLDHTSGLQGWGDAVGAAQFDAALLADLGANHSLADAVELARTVPPSGPPDGTTRYSNVGYLLAGRIAELVSGRTFAQLVDERIVSPLGLESTYYPVGEAPTTGAAPLPGSYEYDGVVLHTTDVPQTAYLSLMGPAIGAMSSVPDLVVWGRSVLRDGRLGPTNLASMSDIGPGGVGLGVIGVDPRFGDCVFDGCPADADFTILAMNGELPGASTRLWYDTANGVIVFVYLNRDGVSLDAPMLAVLRDLATGASDG